MSDTLKVRQIYQERLAKRQAVERLRRAYSKLYTQAPQGGKERVRADPSQIRTGERA